MIALAETAGVSLGAWQNFYSIVGASAGALIGLQFVVITLIGDRPVRADTETINAFGTPTVVHFSWALAVSAFMAAPWSSLHGLAVLLVLCGICGVAYSVIVFRRARRQSGYEPVAEDWVFYTILPFIFYAAVTAGALLLLKTATQTAMFLIAAAALGLLFVGIRNAWDTVMHIVSITGRSDATKQ